MDGEPSSSSTSTSGSESGSTTDSQQLTSTSTGAQLPPPCGCPPADAGELIYILDFLRVCEDVPEPCAVIELDCPGERDDGSDASAQTCIETVELTPEHLAALDCHLEFLETGSPGSVRNVLTWSGGFSFRTRQIHVDSQSNAVVFDELVVDSDGTATSSMGEGLTQAAPECAREATPNERLLCLWNLAGPGDPFVCE